MNTEYSRVESILSDSVDNENSKKQKKNFSERLQLFSIKYLAHHPSCKKFDNHIFRIGKLFLCVGCTSVFLGFISYTVIFFSLLSSFRRFPYITGTIAAFGVGMALMQVFLKPKFKLFKAFFRFCLGVGLGAYIALIVQVSTISQLGGYSMLVQVALFLLLIPGVYLYNVLRGDSPYLECESCSVKLEESTCDYLIDS